MVEQDDFEQPDPPMRKGDALGWMLGGVCAMFLAAMSLAVGKAMVPCSADVSFEQSPATYVGVVTVTVAFGIGGIVHGGRRYRAACQYEKAQRDEPSPTPAQAAGRSFLRIVVALLLAVVSLLVGGPLLGLAGRPACLAVGGMGVALHLVGMFRKGHVMMGIGFIMAVSAGLGLWIAAGN